MTQEAPEDIVAAARQVTGAMRVIDGGIKDLAAAAGYLTAMADNADKVQTLSSIRADTGYQLVGQLTRAYDDLAAYFLTEFT